MQQAPGHTDIWAVDTACLVPVTLFKKSYAKAYAFRTATSKMRDERLKNLPYPSRTVAGLPPQSSAREYYFRGSNQNVTALFSFSAQETQQDESLTSTVCQIADESDESSVWSPEVDKDGAKSAAKLIPWGSVDLQSGNMEIGVLLQKTDAFDHSVPGVTHMPGGQKAGYARWEAFKKTGLSQYAARRNNAMLR